MALKLPARLVLLFLAAGLAPLGITLLVLAPRGQDALRTSAKLLHQTEVEALQVRLDGAFDDLLADVRLLSQPDPHAAEAATADPSDVGPAKRALLRFLLEKHEEVTAATLFEGTQKVPGGQAFDRRLANAADLAIHEAEAVRLLERSTMEQAKSARFYPSRSRREMRVTLVAPFPAAGPRVRLAVEVRMRRAQELVEKTRIGRRGSAFIVDAAGRLVASRDREGALAQRDVSGSSIVQQLRENIAREQATGRPLTVVTDFTDEGVEQVGAFAPLSRLGWGVVVKEPRDDAYGLARATWAHAAGWTLLSLILAILAAVFFARDITRPVSRLMQTTKGLAAGAFGHSVPVEGPPEIAELARTFNEASRRLFEYDGENKSLLAKVERGYLETLRALVNAIEAKDPYTAGHSQRTAEFALAISRALQLSEAKQREIEFGALLHDIGKIGIAEQILRKPAALDDAEMAIMRGHPAIGDGVVHNIEILAAIRPIVRNHHERWDGSGYPDGLSGEAIPLGARIVAVADTYDAITSDRCYQVGRSANEAVAILKRLSGLQLDAEVISALFRVLVELGLVEPSTLEDPAPQAAPVAERARRPTLDIVTSAKKVV